MRRGQFLRVRSSTHNRFFLNHLSQIRVGFPSLAHGLIWPPTTHPERPEMIQLPATLGQRILDAARIAAAMHEQSLRANHVTLENAGGAGRDVVVDHDGALSIDGTPLPPDRRVARV